MLATVVLCAQCGLEAGLDAELERWRHGELVLVGEVDGGDGLLLCPDCDAEVREQAFEEGEGG